MRRDTRDDHEGPQAHARDRSRARRGRAGGGSRHRLNTAEVFDRAAATYDVAAFPFFTPFGEALVAHAQIEPQHSVLDLGCGAGAALAPASRSAKRAVGVELSPGMAARAREAAPGAEVVVGDASSLTFADGEFDRVLSAFSIFFMPDPTAALREWARVMAPGGRMVLSTWGGADPRWSSWERGVRMEFAPEADPAKLQELGTGLALLNRFDEAAKVEEELRAAGLVCEDVAEHSIEFVFPDEQAYWDLNWSHGARMFFEALPDAALERLRERTRDAMEAVRDERGFPRTYTALFATARRDL